MLLCLVGLAFGPSTAANSTIDPEVIEIILRTRETQGTYAVYMWNEVTPKDKTPFAEWSAEFHSGNLHRVENPNIRMIADCKAMTGTFLEIQTQKRIEGAQVARMACGINSNPKILSARKIGFEKSDFGDVTEIEIIDTSERRTYKVTFDGILVGSTIGEVAKGGHVWVVNRAFYVSRIITESDIFSENSLNRSFVSQKFRVPSGGK
jgi:hypothetical protein